MIIICIDSDFKCHTTNKDGTFRKIDTDFFVGKCDAFIEGYRFVPKGESWMRSDGVVFRGEMATSWKEYRKLDTLQRDYEKQQLKEYENNQEELTASYQEGINSI